MLPVVLVAPSIWLGIITWKFLSPINRWVEHEGAEIELCKKKFSSSTFDEKAIFVVLQGITWLGFLVIGPNWVLLDLEIIAISDLEEPVWRPLSQRWKWMEEWHFPQAKRSSQRTDSCEVERCASFLSWDNWGSNEGIRQSNRPMKKTKSTTKSGHHERIVIGSMSFSSLIDTYFLLS